MRPELPSTTTLTLWDTEAVVMADAVEEEEVDEVAVAEEEGAAADAHLASSEHFRIKTSDSPNLILPKSPNHSNQGPF